jgi:hypothetical protein
MAIRDLLWACPACRSVASIHAVGRAEICRNCRARFERTDGARIRVSDATRTEVRDPVDWEADLPPIDSRPENGSLGPEPIILRLGLPARPVRSGRRFIGWAERFGPRRAGTAQLSLDRLQVRLHTGAEWDWPLEAIDAVQPSSSTLQIHARATLLSIRFLSSSVRRWEAVLCASLQSLYARTGRGVITEFQPRIRTA